MSAFPRLDRYDAMQNAPLGTFSSLRRPSPVATQYKRQSEMYGQALRTLSRAARRGDAGAARDAIDVRNQANNEGFAPGGIRDAQSFQGNIAGREQTLRRGNAILERENEFLQGRPEPVNPNAAVIGRDAPNPEIRDQAPVNPNSTMIGRGRGSTMEMRNWEGTQNGEMGDRRPGDTLDNLAPRSFDEQEAEARERSTSSGAFGTLARDRLKRRKSVLDRATLDLPNPYRA